uniref:Uncharacterized protein LOC105055973 isoform X1 n=1 Tax=Elaeis guineensis var. tenera TaxID=51953 RepID=A0A6I9S3A4_ELAGV|nr:uncharacterized protein LOC105055973 isoform X1 [Elaeis guineensis]XP_010936316.1 uncharacterized protein LOC105055973 isoform X1 [Elaeis guineensis]XP_019710061.1 uncharacterized protein LOC105055973 isoform X1 [Elaeis guineensis]XP_029123669.1 uncharacterized protein LOC105055973 isoform X1 [Elaeis guineensis]
MQLWQQQLMYKQLQQLQRQQQLQQLDQGPRQQNPLNQLSSAAKPAAMNQFPAPINEIPINDASNYAWSNNFVGGESKSPGIPQMFVAGNTNWTQPSGSPAMQSLTNGMMFPNDQGQAIQAMGFVPQQLDQSLHGMPVSSSRGSMNQYSQFQGMPSDNMDMMTKTVGNQAEKVSMHSGPLRSFQSGQSFAEQAGLQDNISMSTQSFQGKSLFGNAMVQSVSSSVASGNFQQANHLQRSFQFQNFQGMQEQADLSGDLHEKPAPQVGPSHDVASLDPTEQKLLFGTDNDDNWGFSFGRSVDSCTGGSLHGNSLDNDYCGAFPSVQSGSWSALMQEAVQASSSDMGHQEEWSGLTFHKREPSIGNHLATPNDNGKQQATWKDNNLQNTPSLTSRPLPLFNNADASTSLSTAPGFHHSFTSVYEQNDKVPAEASHESFQQLARETQNKQSLHNQNQKQFLEGGLQSQMHTNDGVGAGQSHGQMENNSCYATVESKSHNMQGAWTHQQNMPLSNTTTQSSNKPNGWNMKHSLVNDDTKYGQRNNTNRFMNIERSCDGSVWKVSGNQVTLTGGPQSVKSDIGSPQMQSDASCMGNITSVMDSSTLRVNQEMNQYLFNRHQIDRGKHVALDSFVNSANDENVGGNQYNRSSGSQAWESTRNNAGKELVENYDSKHEHSKVVSNEDYMSNHSNLGQHRSSGGAARESPLSTEDDPHALGSGSQKSFCQSGQQTLGSHMLQYPQMESMGMNIQPSILPFQASYPQGLPRSVIQGSNQEQRYIGHSQFAGPVASNNVIGMAKGNFSNLERSPKGAEDMQSRGTVPNHDSTGYASFDGSSAQDSQNKGIGHTSQDMLELLHKVDQSRDVKSIATSDITEAAVSDISASRPQLVQSSASQGFGLRLGPPSQRQPVSNQPSQTSLHDFSSKQLDHESRNKDRTWLASMASIQPLPHETSKIENWDTKCIVTGHTCRETSQSYSQVNSSSAAALDLSHTGIQSQQQRQQHHLSRASGNETVELSAKVSLGSLANVNSSIKNIPLRQQHESHDRVLADQPFQASVPNLSGRIPPFRLASSADTHAPPASPFYSAQTDHSQPMDAGFSRTGNSGQQLSVVDSGSGSQSSTSGMPQQVGFSKMLHKVWTNISAQRLAGIQPRKLTPAILQSMILSSNNRSAGPWGLQKADDQKQKGENAPSEAGTCSVKSQQAIYGDEHPVMDSSLQQVSSEGLDVAAKTGIASQGQEPMRKHMLEGSPAVSISSLVRLHQQDASKGKHGQDSACNSQMVHVPLTNAASSSGDVGLYWHTSVPSDVKQQNYSLLHQMQAMKGADSDPSKRAGKRLKGSDLGSDASQMDWKAGQGLVYGQNMAFRVPADSELGATSHSSFASDVKMLSFASRDNEARSASMCSQLSGREASSQDMRIVGSHDLQSHVHSSSTCSTSGLVGGSKHPHISPQMAPSWFGQYGTYKNGQILAVYDGQRTIKPATQQFHFPKVSGSMDNSSIVAQRMDRGHLDGLGRSTLSTAIAANESSPGCLPSDVMDHDIVLRKKRKSATSELLPWHKEVTHGSRRLQTISMAELEWTQASNRLTEKVEDEAEILEDGFSVPRPRRRLIFTTQLMQQLLPAIPAAILKTETTSAYESATYCVAKSALLDACSLIDCSGSDSSMQLDKENMISEKLETSEKVGDNIYSKVVEDFIGRSKQLESEFLRLDRRTSMLDARLECQELERFSIVNRLGKFHGRNHTDGVESSSTSENASRKTFMQRYVTALSMPGNLPEGVFCLSL